MRPRFVRFGCLHVLVALVVLSGVAWATRATLLSAVGSLIIEETPLGPADVVVLLTQDVVLGAAAAADVVRPGFAPRVLLFATPDPQREMLRRLALAVPTGSELGRLVLERRGVPPRSIVVEPLRSSGTNDTLRQLAALATHRGWHRLVVITYRSHTRRTAVLLRRALGGNAVVIVRAPPEDLFRADTWWHDREGVREFAMESLRWVNSIVLGDLWR